MSPTIGDVDKEDYMRTVFVVTTVDVLSSDVYEVQGVFRTLKKARKYIDEELTQDDEGKAHPECLKWSSDYEAYDEASEIEYRITEIRMNKED